MKKLLTKSNIHNYISEGENELYVDSSMIISPGVKDILRNKGIVIVYGQRKEDSSKEITECKEVSGLNKREKHDDESEIIKTVTNLLLHEFKITDDEIIKKIIEKVLNKI